MTHLVFTHGRWQGLRPYAARLREPEAGDTFSEHSSPLRSALQDLRERGLDAHTFREDVWKIKHFIQETLACEICNLQYVVARDGWVPSSCPACGAREKMVVEING